MDAQKAKSAAGNFAIQAEKDETGGEALFEVKRSDGSVAFAVYEDMVWVYAKEDTKGLKGGFAVGGYNSTKAGQDEYMRITPDSVRVYINEENVKGKKGGFAVGGYKSATKGIGEQYLHVSGNDPATDDYSIALGVKADASGPYSTAIGYNSLANGYSSFAAGLNSQATSSNSIAIGNSTISAGNNATSMGYQSETNGERSIAIGSYYSHSFSLLPYFDYGKKDDSKNDFIIWQPIINPIFRTIYFNRANVAEGKYSVSLGNGNWSKDGGLALGSNNDAHGFGSVALGVSNKAINTSALAAGYSSDASGYYAAAIGNNSSAKAYGSFVIGQYNLVTGDSTKWVSTDPLFIVGNGLNDANRNNALTIYKNGRSVFMGADANLTLNDRRTRFFYDFTSGAFSTALEVYGIRSYVNRIDPAVDNYYSGFFFDTGTEGEYLGFFADLRSGDGGDVAEYIIDTEGNTTPGDVLIADPNNNESVLISKDAYQPSVIGVVSTDPHLVMNMQIIIDEETGSSLEGVQATRLALTGRVPCKVTDENGPIQPGDLLTTSSTPGHAMKWTPVDVTQAQDFETLKSMLAINETRRHAIIGKALEAHNGGTGKIMVLISLQ
ncbi:MAG: hypothetical protein P1P82_11050 [Bacteroidales bacterium]|nr:hypothetical protein [Bacteroidales bacterium]MDT8432233.1 hypothetical protein [Bacteroidales bacterium]